MIDIEPYIILRKINPCDVMEIITCGLCDDLIQETKIGIIRELGKYYLTNWKENYTLDILGTYISDCCWSIIVDKDRAYKLKTQFDQLNIFKEVRVNFFNSSYYEFAIMYSKREFSTLYNSWKMNKKINKILD